METTTTQRPAPAQAATDGQRRAIEVENPATGESIASVTHQEFSRWTPFQTAQPA